MTRGRDTNHAYVAVEDNQTALDVLSQAIVRDWIDQPAITRRTQLETRQQPTHGDDPRDNELTAEERRTRRLIDERLVAIQHRRRTIGRDQLTTGR